MLRLTLLAAGLAALAGPALAQSNDRATRPIEVLVVARDAAPRCEPQELRVPADANIDLRIRNEGTRTVEVRAPDLFKSPMVHAVTGATEADAKGAYLVDPAQSAQMILRTPPTGSYRFACADRGAPDPQTTGSLTTVR